jgi:hypothetical protein
VPHKAVIQQKGDALAIVENLMGGALPQFHEKLPSALSRKLHTRAPVHRLGGLDQRELQDHLQPFVPAEIWA